MGDAQNPVGVEQQGRVLVATMDDGGKIASLFAKVIPSGWK